MKLIIAIFFLIFTFYFTNWYSIEKSTISLFSKDISAKGFAARIKGKDYIITNRHFCTKIKKNLEIHSLDNVIITSKPNFKVYDSDLCLITTRFNLNYYPFNLFQTIKIKTFTYKSNIVFINKDFTTQTETGNDNTSLEKEFCMNKDCSKTSFFLVTSSDTKIIQGESGSPVFDYNLRFKGIVVGTDSDSQDRNSIAESFFIPKHLILKEIK